MLWVACGCVGGPTPAEYPDVKITAAAMKLRVVDTRKSVEELSKPPSRLPSGASVSFDKALPESFGSKAQGRFDRLPSGTGPSLEVEAEVVRAGTTHFATIDGDFTRFDVELRFTVRSTEGAKLLQMRGSAWNEMPTPEATIPEQARVYELTCLQAVDNVFASEDTLEKLNRELAAYEKRPR